MNARIKLAAVALIATVVLILNACSGKTKDPKTAWNDQQKERIAKLEELLEKDVAGKHADSVNVLLTAYQDYYNKNLQDSLSGVYLMQAARLAEGTGKYKKAIELLFNYHENFKAAPNRDFAVYRIAFIYDEHLKDKTQAAHYYNQVISLHPDSPWAKEAQNALNILYMSDEELLHFLKSRNGSPV